MNRKYWPGPGTGFRSLLFAQSLGTLIAGLGVVFLPAPALAALAGGGICLAAHGWAAWQLRPRPGSAGAERVLARLVWAEAGKVTIILTLFALSFRFAPDTHQPETLGAMLTGFIGAQGAGWLYIARFGGMDGTGQGAGDQDRN